MEPLQTKTFVEAARARGFNFYVGVPCSFLTPLINYVINDRTTRYVGATSEGEAIAIAAGAWLAGQKSIVMFQNSGLGNTVNPLTSLNAPFQISTLLITTWRSQPGLKDEPQHWLMGRITPNLFSLMEIPYATFPKSATEVATSLEQAEQSMVATQLPYALIMEKGTLANESLETQPLAERSAGNVENHCTGAKPPTRFRAIETIVATMADNVAIIATTGKTGRELFTVGDRPQQLYVVGSMGGASALGLGVALNVKRPVLVIDGDGAALMKLGNFATIGAYEPENLIHVLLDNGVHDSTGGQATVSGLVDFAAIAVACRYRRAIVVDTLKAFAEALQQAQLSVGPTLIQLKIQPGSIENLGRPTIPPHEVARRFRRFLTT